MNTLINQAFSVGWTAKQILDFVSNKMKHLSPSVDKARSSGYTDDDILKFIAGKVKTGKVEEPDTPYGRYLKQSGYLTKEERQSRS